MLTSECWPFCHGLNVLIYEIKLQINYWKKYGRIKSVLKFIFWNESIEIGRKVCYVTTSWSWFRDIKDLIMRTGAQKLACIRVIGIRDTEKHTKLDLLATRLWITNSLNYTIEMEMS